MRIIHKTTEKKEAFGDLESGSVVRSDSGNYYIKLHPTCDLAHDCPGYKRYNAISLGDGRAVRFNIGTEVTWYPGAEVHLGEPS